MAEGNVYFGTETQELINNFLDDSRIVGNKYQEVLNAPRPAAGKYDERAMQHFIDCANNYNIADRAKGIEIGMLLKAFFQNPAITEEEKAAMNKDYMEVEEWRERIIKEVEEIKGQLGLA